jgi:Protein of unknown function (DUF559)
VVGRRQLLALGVEAETMKRWLRDGRLHRLHRGAFAVGHGRVSQRGHWLAAVLACDDGALLSHASAAALWGLARRRGSTVDVTGRCGRQFRPGRERIRLHRCRLHDGDGTQLDGIPVTTVARTLFDLAEAVTSGELRGAWEEADRLGLLQLRAVERVCELGYGRRALRPIRSLLSEARAPAVTRSALEDRFAAFCRRHDLPTPLTNVSVLGHEVDAHWPAQGLVVELDGFAYHGHRAAFERDRARDAALQAAGYRVVRLTHRQLRREAPRIATQLRKLLGVEHPSS